MDIAYTMAPGRGDTDLLLHRLADRLVAEGLRPAGTVQVNSEVAGAGPCDMDVIVLPSGPRIRISQSLGPSARGCRLDAGALEQAVGLAQARLHFSDCLIVNKFGKHEAEGKGFRPLIAEALASGLPVLVGLNLLNAPAFAEFSGGLARHVAPEEAKLYDWIMARVGVVRTA